MEDHVWEAMQAASCVLGGRLPFWTDDEMILLGLSAKRAAGHRSPGAKWRRRNARVARPTPREDPQDPDSYQQHHPILDETSPERARCAVAGSKSRGWDEIVFMTGIVL